MPNTQPLRTADSLAGACRRPRLVQLRKPSTSVPRAQDAASQSVAATPHQAAERQHASAPSSTGLEISRKHSKPDSTSCRHGGQLSSSQAATWQAEQAEDRSVRKRGHDREAAQAGLWCWEWGSTRWRASFFFLMASVAFVIGSAASLQPHMFAGTFSYHQKASSSFCSISFACEAQLLASQAKEPPCKPISAEPACVQAVAS